MIIGCCGGIEERDMLRKTGYDFIECPVGIVEPGKGEEEFKTIKNQLKDTNLLFYAFNIFIPGDLKITGPEVDFLALEDYVEIVLSRVQSLGGKVIVFGSGGARRVPEKFSRVDAWMQIKRFLEMVADKAGQYNITIAIEPLRSEETNIINTLEEGLQMAREVNRAEIRVLVDLYHMVQENEPFEHIKDAGELLVHVHVADTGRFYPGSGDYDYDTFLEMLSDINYDGGISIECNWDNKEDEVKKALSFLKNKVRS